MPTCVTALANVTVALVALMRKLIEIANALVKADRLWAEKPACA